MRSFEVPIQSVNGLSEKGIMGNKINSSAVNEDLGYLLSALRAATSVNSPSHLCRGGGAGGGAGCHSVTIMSFAAELHEHPSPGYFARSFFYYLYEKAGPKKRCTCSPLHRQ